MKTKHTIKILLLIAIFLFVNGCDNGVCITPDQIYMETVSVDAWMYPDQDHEDSNGWIASGIEISEDEEANIKVTGNGNMCGLTSETRSQNSSVSDEDLRDYVIRLDFNNQINTNAPLDSLNSSILPKKGPNVMPGDFISISIEPIQVKINCQNPPSNVKILDYNICMNGGEIDMSPHGKTKIPAFQNTMQDIMYVTDKNVLGNIIYYNRLMMNSRNWYASNTTTNDTYRFYDLIIPVQKDLPKIPTRFPNNYTIEQISKETEDKIPAFNLMQMQQMIDLNLIDIPTSASTDPNKPEGMLLYKTLKPMLLPASIVNTPNNKYPTSMLKNLDLLNANLIKLNEKIAIKEKGIIVIAIMTNNISGGAKIKITRDCAQRALDSIYITASDKMTNKSEPLQPNQKIIKLTSLRDLSAEHGTTANTDATHSYTLPKNTLKGYIYIKTDRNNDTYENNTGKYTLKISKPRRFSGTISKGVSDIKNSILDMVDGKLDQNGNRVGGAGHEMYQTIIRNPALKSLIYAMLTLYITLKGIKYMSGIEPLTKESVVMSAIKASIVISIVNPTTFGIIRDFFHRICIDGLDFLINATTSFDTKFTTKTDFSFMDSSLGRFTIHETGIQMLALFISGPVGWVVLIAIIVSVCVYGFTVLMSAVLYLMNIILISFLIALLPLFTLTILFKFTSKIFHTWIKVLITNILKPILLFISLAILNQLMMAALFNIFNFTVCDDCSLGFQLIPGIALFCLISGPIPMGYSPMLSFEKKAERAASFAQSTFFTIPIPFEDVIIMLFIAFSSKSIATRSGTIASSITSTFGGSMTMAAVSAVFDKALGLFGMDKESRDRRARSYKDQMTSKSTELSDKEKDAFTERGNKRQNNSNKNALYDKDDKSQLSTKISETNDLEKISRKKTNSEAADDLNSFKGSPIDQMLSKKDKPIEEKETKQDKYKENIKDKYKKDITNSDNTSTQSKLTKKSQTRPTLQTDKESTLTKDTEKDRRSREKLTFNNKQNKQGDNNESDV